MGGFPDAQGQLTPQSLVGSCPILKPIQDFMAVLVTCKNEEASVKIKGA